MVISVASELSVCSVQFIVGTQKGTSADFQRDSAALHLEVAAYSREL